MQKKLIALAIAGLAGSAFAQTNVTIYGVADATFEWSKASGATSYRNGYQLNASNPALVFPAVVGSAATGYNNVFSGFQADYNNVKSQTRLSTNSSLIGFKGVEDLGNGLKAVFQFETGADFTGDAGALAFTRDSYVGLTGGFGTAVAGTLTHPIRLMGAKVDFNPGASSAGFTGLYGEFLGVKTGTDDRAKNAVAYVTPNFSGFTGTVAYVSSGVAAGADNGNTDALNATQNGQRVCQFAANGVPTACAANGTGTLTPMVPANALGTTGLHDAGSTHSQQWQVAATYENGPLWVSGGYHHAQDPRAGAAVLGALTGAVSDASWSRTAGQYNNVAFTNNPVVGAGGVVAGWNGANPGIANGATVNGVTYTSVSQATLNAIRANQVAVLNTASYKDSLNAWRLAGKYTFSTGTSISALYDWQKYKFSNAGTYVSGYTFNTAGQITGLNAGGLVGTTYVNGVVASTAASVQSVSGSAKRSAWMVGANQNFGKANVWLQYARANNTKGDLIDAAGVDGSATGANQWTLGASYDLSKRTMLHGFYTAVTNKSNAAYDNYVNGGQNTTAATSAGADTKVWGAGLRHSF